MWLLAGLVVVTLVIIAWALRSDPPAPVVAPDLAAVPVLQPAPAPRVTASAAPATGTASRTLGEFHCANVALAEVNGVAVRGEQLCPRLVRLAGSGTSPAIRNQAKVLLQAAITAELIAQALAGEVVTDADIDAALAAGTALSGHPSPTSLAELSQRGEDPQDLRSELRQRLGLARLVAKRLVAVTEADVRAAYDQDPDKWGVRMKTTVQPWLLRLALTASAHETATAQAAAQQLVDALRKGQDAAKAAPRLGLRALPAFDVEPGGMEADLARVAFSTVPGQVADPVKTKGGWLVIRVTGRQDPERAPFADVAGEVRRVVEARRRQEARDAVVAELRAKGNVKILVDW